MGKIADRLMTAMKSSKITYVELARRTGISKSALQRYATGETEKIPLDRLEQMAQALDVSAEYLLGWEQIKHPEIHTVRILDLIEKNHTSCEEISKITGCSVKEIQSWISHYAQVPQSCIGIIAKYYNVSIDYLIGKSDSEGIYESKNFIYRGVNYDSPVKSILQLRLEHILNDVDEDTLNEILDYAEFKASKAEK